MSILDNLEGGGVTGCNTDHDNHVRMMRVHRSYFAFAGMIPLKEACMLSTKASIAGMEGDLDKMLGLMLEAQKKADEYQGFITRQIYAMNPELRDDNHGFKLAKFLKKWPQAKGLVNRLYRRAQ